jgi:hypothetical protein
MSMKTREKIIGLVITFFCLFVLSALPPAQATTDHFTDSFVLIMGKCETVQTPVLWLFGFKVILNREIIIQANGGADEKLTALILPSKIGFYFGQDNMVVQLQGAKGLFFRGEKSFLFQNTPQRFFALCKATDIWVTYDI